MRASSERVVTKGSPRRLNRASPARSSVVPNLTSLLRREREVLVRSAMSGGLCVARRRCMQERVAMEAARFLDVLCRILKRSPKVALEEAVSEEVRTGAFAAAGQDEIKAVFNVWRRTLESFALEVGSPFKWDKLIRALTQFEEAALSAAGPWADERVDVVVIGASAGGIPALYRVLGSLHQGLPATLLVVQHVSMKSPGVLAAMLARACDLSVAHAVDGGDLYLEHVYVAPPGRHLAVIDHKILLSDEPPVRHAKPAADVLFASAAHAIGPNVASIVLSGADSDGANGSRAVRAGGGVVMVQRPSTAIFPSMPESAIATGAVEFIISLPFLGDAVEVLVRQGRSALAALSTKEARPRGR
jgi:two-component system chemotaxis response regulator CheB